YAVEITVGDCSLMSDATSFEVTEPVFNKRTGLHFDGVDDYIQTSYPGVLGSANRTFEAWIYVPAPVPSSSFGILDYGTNDVGSRNTFLVKNDNSLKFVSGGTNANMGTDPNTVPLDTWTHVAFVLNNGTGYLYINGAEAASANLTTVNTPSGYENVLIGNRVSGPNTMFFGGFMDEFRMWDVARSATEILETMNTELCGDEAGLVIYYPLGEGTPGEDNTGVVTLTDMSATGDDATLNNFALSGTASNWVEGHSLLVLEGATLTAAQEGSVYQWVDCDNGNAVIDGATEQAFTPEVSGNYAVEITVDGCVTTSACMAVDVNALGVEENLMETMKVFPNPTSGNLNIALNGVYQTVEAQLVSITGKVVGEYQFNNTNGFELNTSNFNSGLYFLKLKADNKDAVTVKVLKM
ncbi:LamG-like jellyroll fold domain-containing protein, partial [Mangrovimonas sp. DI 80]|uniref:LamG-like jellyroll fold domain-containing protein n=1 Tax=Mangrovimonas sp. DI 80 TaxID=1779330 RepID=UPI0009D4A761